MPVEIVFGTGGCSGFKYVYTSTHSIWRAATTDWYFTDVAAADAAHGFSGILVPLDTSARRGSFAIGTNSYGGTRLFYSNYNDHSVNPAPGGMIWKSDDSDNCGGTWTLLKNFGGREVHSVNADPGSTSTIYAVIDDEGTEVVPPLWRSTDGGDTFYAVAGNLTPIDLVFPAGSNQILMEPDAGVSGPLFTWDKVTPGATIQQPAQYPQATPSWNGPDAEGIGLTSEQNVFIQSDGQRTGFWYLAPPYYNAPVLLEDVSPPIDFVASSDGITATVVTAVPHQIQPINPGIDDTGVDQIIIHGVTPSTFDTVDSQSRSTYVPVTVTGPYSFNYPCTPTCPVNQEGTGGSATKDGVYLWPGRTVDVTDPNTGIGYLYSSNFGFIKPEFTGAHQILSNLSLGGGYFETFFLGTDQHVHMMFYNANSGAWGNHDVNSYADVPSSTLPAPGSALSCAFLYPYAATFFIGTDQHVHMMLNNLSEGAWGNHDINSYATGPSNVIPVAGSALSSLYLSNSSIDVFFLGDDQHVHLLQDVTGTWTSYDLNVSAGAPNAIPIPGSALSSLDLGNGNSEVFFIGTDQHVHVLTGSSGIWSNYDINASATTPSNVVPAVWSQLSTLDLGSGNSETFFVGTDLHVHRLLKMNGVWENDDLSALAGSPTNVAPMLASPLQAYSLPNGASATFFTGTDQHAHELFYNGSNSWTNNDISAIAGAPTNVLPAVRSPYTTINIANVYYETFFIGADQHVHMMLNDTNSATWGNHDINSYAGAPTNVFPAAP
jgi:hypothetical protein